MNYTFHLIKPLTVSLSSKSFWGVSMVGSFEMDLSEILSIFSLNFGASYGVVGRVYQT
jgi:hypothetical protein